MSAAELFAGAGSKPGVEVWRIEKMRPVKQPDGFSGKFHTGDSYIVLHTWERSGATHMNAHFWIGAESTRDEAGAAALLTVELDQLLGDLPTQFRETQGRESDEFLQLFPNGVRYLAGGVDSAFNVVDRDARVTRLLHVKGSRNVRVMEVPVALASLNSGDVFILDDGANLTQWNGARSSKREKSKALDITLAIKNDERGGTSTVSVVDEEAPLDDAARAFFHALGCDDAALAARNVASAEDGGADADADAAAFGAAAVRLYHLRDDGAAGTLTFSEVTVRPLSKEHLQTEDVFVLVAGGAAYVWIGKKSSPAERAGANEFLAGGERAAKFLEANGLTSASSVKVVKEMTEPALFKQAFHRWGASPPTAKPKSPKPRETRERREVDVDALAARNGARERGDDDGTIDSVDDAAGELKCWRVENFKLVPVAEAEYGKFHAGDSYVLRHTYDGGKRRVIYFWQGRDSTADEKGASALLAKEMDEALGGDATQVRVAQGKEPDHFLRLFRGRMIVRTGGVASGFKNANDGDTRDVDGVSLYHVRGTSDLDTRAVQVADDSACLNSGDCFILTLDATATGADPRVFVWEGSGSSREERECAALVATLLAPSVGVGSSRVEIIAEHAEPDAFWARIGGKKPYAEFAERAPPPQDPRLFHVSDAATGGLGVCAEEIFRFTQDDLEDEDVMLLDVTSEVFLWIGSRANENEKREARALAERYVAAMAATDGRDVDTPVVTVAAGAEPAMFTCHFIGWDAEARGRTFADPYEEKLKNAVASNPSTFVAPALKKTPAKKRESSNTASNGALVSPELDPARLRKTRDVVAKDATKGPATPSPASGVVAVTVPPGSKVISYDELKAMDGTVGIDMERKESYLSREEFVVVFGVDAETFEKLPAWKRKESKKRVGLF